MDTIYSSHALEYFDRDEVKEVLSEWKRVLKPGGILRTSVPDFESIVKVYLDSDKNLNARGILGPLFGRWKIENKSEESYIYQKTTYDFSSLKTVLETAGFNKVERYNWWDVLPKDYDDYSMAYIPHMDKENGLLLSLNVESVK